jgi:hypothetical protein
MLLELAVWRQQSLGRLLDLHHGPAERIDPVFDLLQSGGALFQRRQPRGQGVHLARRATGALVDLLERPTKRRELGPVHLDLGQHGAQRRPLFTGRADQLRQLGHLLFRRFPLVSRCTLLEHVGLQAPSVTNDAARVIETTPSTG